MMLATRWPSRRPPESQGPARQCSDKSHPGWDGFAGWGGRLPGVSAQRDFLLSAQFVPALYFGTDQVRVAATTPWLRGNLPRYSRLKR